MATKFFDRVRVLTATTGQGTLTFGAATSDDFLTPVESGAVDGDTPTYLIQQGADFEIGTGLVGGGVTTMTRTVIRSKKEGVAGTNKLELDGESAEVMFVPSATNLNDIYGLATYWTRRAEVIHTSDYVVDRIADRGKQLVMNSASTRSFELYPLADADEEVLAFRNIGSGGLYIHGADTDELIDNSINILLASGESVIITPNEDNTAWRASKMQGGNQSRIANSLIPQTDDAIDLGDLFRRIRAMYIVDGLVFDLDAHILRTSTFEIEYTAPLSGWLSFPDDTRFSGPVTITGDFTSLGIDDNATGERMQLADTLVSLGVLGAAYSIRHIATDQNLDVFGGAANTAGGIRLYAASHASKASDVEILANNVVRYHYDFSALTHEFTGIVNLATGQLAFPASPNLSSDPNTFDDYKEFSFTITAAFATPGTSSWAYATQAGRGTKLGRLVYLPYDFSGTPTIGTGTGNVTLLGNPYAVSGNHTLTIGSMGANWTWAASRTTVFGAITNGTTPLQIFFMGSNIAASSAGAATMTGGSAHVLRASGCTET